jgi:osmoprotectant transport system permease protein
MDQLIAFFTDPKNWTGNLGIPSRLFEHLQISVLAVIVAALIAVPIGLYIGHTNRGSNFAINVANIGRAIPSYGLMALLLIVTLELSQTGLYTPQFGLTFLPAFLAMMFLAIPPLLVATYAGLRSVDRELIEAGRGMGLRESQILRRIEVPLAMSIIVGGLRTATLQVIATATIAAILGGGGLGRFIFDGIAQGESGNGKVSIFAGAILVTLLAIGVDLFLAWAQTRLTPVAIRRRPARGPRRSLGTGWTTARGAVAEPGDSA